MIDLIACIFGAIGTILFSIKQSNRNKEVIVQLLYAIADLFTIAYMYTISSITFLFLYIFYFLCAIMGIIINLRPKKPET